VSGEPQLRLCLPAVPESLPLIRHVVATLVQAQPLAPRRQQDVLSALATAAADAVGHAAHDRAAPSELVVEGRANARRLVITIIEEGPGIALLIGRGGVPGSLARIGAVADRVELGRADCGGASTRMSFRLNGPPAAG
jgi:hypothetical protein